MPRCSAIAFVIYCFLCSFIYNAIGQEKMSTDVKYGTESSGIQCGFSLASVLCDFKQGLLTIIGDVYIHNMSKEEKRLQISAIDGVGLRIPQCISFQYFLVSDLRENCMWIELKNGHTLLPERKSSELTLAPNSVEIIRDVKYSVNKFFEFKDIKLRVVVAGIGGRFFWGGRAESSVIEVSVK